MITRSDIRTFALSTAALAVTAVPTIGPLLRGTGEQTDRYDTSITPPDYAFAVWAPIFAGILANAGQATIPNRRNLPDNAATGWPLTAAYTLNTLWSVAAQSDHFAYTAALLPAAVVATGVAYRRLQDISQPAGTTSASTGLLLGWTSLAATVNLSAATQLLGAQAGSRTSIRLSALAAATTATALAVSVSRSRRGFVPLASASTWGLATTALDRRRPVLTRVVAGAGAAAIAVSAAVNLRSRNRGALSGHPTSPHQPLPCDG